MQRQTAQRSPALLTNQGAQSADKGCFKECKRRLHKTKIMSEVIQKFTTVAECDAAIANFVKKQKALIRRQVNLTGQKESYEETSEAIANQIAKLENDIQNYHQRLEAGPTEEEKADLEDRLITAEYNLYRAHRREENYGRPEYAGKEFDLDLVDYSVDKAAEFIQAVEARKAQL